MFWKQELSLRFWRKQFKKSQTRMITFPATLYSPIGGSEILLQKSTNTTLQSHLLL